MIEIKTLSLFQGNPQNNDQITDFYNSFTQQTQSLKLQFSKGTKGICLIDIQVIETFLFCKRFFFNKRLKTVMHTRKMTAFAEVRKNSTLS